MGETDVVDAEVVPDGAEAGTELELRSQGALVGGQVVAGATADEIIAHATEIANSLDCLVKEQGFAVSMGGRKPHLEIGAWQALGAMLGALGGEALHAETIPGSVQRVGEKTTYHVHEKKYGKVDGKRCVVSEIDYDVEGWDWEAMVEVKTAGGLVIGRSGGMCSRAESQWMAKPDPALRSMAETRAASRAFRAALGWIVAIAGYNPTPAEEMPATQGHGQWPFGPPADDVLGDKACKAVGYLLGDKPDGEHTRAFLKLVKATTKREGASDEYYPRIVLLLIGVLAGRVKQQRDPAPTSPIDAPELGDDPDENWKRLRAAGCICPDPLGIETGNEVFDDACPIKLHGIPF